MPNDTKFPTDPSCRVGTLAAARRHKSSTSRGDLARETHTIIASFRARSSGSRTLSRWSISPARTAVSHDPHVPSRQVEGTRTSAAWRASRREQSRSTCTVRPLRCRSTSNAVSSAPPAEVRTRGANRSTRNFRFDHGPEPETLRSSMSSSSDSGPQQYTALAHGDLPPVRPKLRTGQRVLPLGLRCAAGEQ
jgi:hypothetical protein